MKLSARNQFEGKVIGVNEGAVNGIVSLDVNGTKISGTISMSAIKELGIIEGVTATAIIKATDVMVAVGELKLSARNQFAGKVTSIAEGAVNDIVVIDTPVGAVSATISKAAVEELGLAKDSEAIAIIKATSVMFAR